MPAHEFSGEIAEVGEGVTGLRAGDAVYGMNDWFAEGALAEYCITRPEWIAPKPACLTTPLPPPCRLALSPHGRDSSTARNCAPQRIFWCMEERERWECTSSSWLTGMHVTATASAHNLGFVKSLGADEVIDYRATPFEEAVGGMDVIFDAVGGETLARSWQVLKPGGRLVTIAGEESASTDERVKHAFFIVEARRDQLVEIARLLDAGQLRGRGRCWWSYRRNCAAGRRASEDHMIRPRE